ncbi:twin arginine-targeting protein translocase TatB [Azonexus hydrophilus]|uniref:Sec-independent protein translocase protein TatB n=1 Tax=Azonexus hydrophilus TaxID=418702 RepID=A0A1R1ID84_9RHOO|nr:Sec-independent protein translocase protein TatB [Azonexus hydrophilus]OMG56738.1 twin arginine-targeting protein translocase TatB [Azonexus hydrophilus]
MFDIGFSELMVIGVVALLVIGPERLPKVARALGHLLGRAQRYVNDVKSDINREMQLDELKKLQAQVSESARSLEDTVRKEYDTVRTGFESPVQSAVAELEATARAAGNEVDKLAASVAEPQVQAPAVTPEIAPPAPAPAVADSIKSTNAA